MSKNIQKTQLLSQKVAKIIYIKYKHKVIV